MKKCKYLYAHLAGMLPHAVLILSLLLLTLFVTDRFNRAMAFLNNDISYVLIWVYAVLCAWQVIEMWIGRYPLWARFCTILPTLGALGLLVGRGLDEVFRRHGIYNREASKWVLFGVCLMMTAHAVLLMVLQRRALARELSKNFEKNE